MKTHALGLCLMLTMLSLAAWAEEPVNHKDGNSIIEQSEAFLEKHPHDAKAQYNLGTVLYHKGDYERAGDLLAQAMGAGAELLRGHAAYNLGSTHYRQARTQEAQNKNQKMQEYENALEHYRVAIRWDSTDRDAQFNYELTQRRMQKLKQKNQQAQQDEQKQDAKREESQEPNSEAQKNSASQDADSKEEPSSESSAASNGARDQQEQSREQNARENSSAGEERKSSSQSSMNRAINEEMQQDSISPQQALWILDNFKREEQKRSLAERQKDLDQIHVEKNW